MSAPQIQYPPTASGGSPVGGSGTANTIPRWTGASTLGDSIITQTGSTRITVGSGAYAGASLDGVRLTNGVNSYFAASDGTRTMFMGADGNAVVGTLTAHDLKIRAGNADAITVRQGTLNVGIGTASPGFKFVVADTVAGVVTSEIRNDSTNSAATARLRFTTQGGESWIEAFRNAGGALTFATLSTERARIDSSGNVGIGTASPGARLHSVAADGTYQFAVSGTTKGIRFLTTASVAQIDAVDQTLSASYQPLLINGSGLSFGIAGGTKWGISASGQFFSASGNGGSASAPTFSESTGVSGVYFPSAATVAIAANGAVAATFSKVAGSGVTLGGTTGLVFDASGNQQGLKLPATPDNTNPNTLDCYEDGGTAGSAGKTFAVTDNSGAGLAITVTFAQYIRIGKLVVIQYDITYPATASGANASLTIPAAAPAQWQAGTLAYQSPGVGVITALQPAVNGSGLVFWSNSTQQTNANLSNKRLILSVSYFMA